MAFFFPWPSSLALVSLSAGAASFLASAKGCFLDAANVVFVAAAVVVDFVLAEEVVDFPVS